MHKCASGVEKNQRVTVYADNSKVKGTPAELSVLCIAVFGVEYRDQICADIGADSNIIDRKMLQRISAAGEDLTIQLLTKSCIFDMAATNSDGARAKLVCANTVSIDTEPHVRYGSTLRFRNLK